MRICTLARGLGRMVNKLYNQRVQMSGNANEMAGPATVGPATLASARRDQATWSISSRPMRPVRTGTPEVAQRMATSVSSP